MFKKFPIKYFGTRYKSFLRGNKGKVLKLHFGGEQRHNNQ